MTRIEIYAQRKRRLDVLFGIFKDCEIWGNDCGSWRKKNSDQMKYYLEQLKSKVYSYDWAPDKFVVLFDW